MPKFPDSKDQRYCDIRCSIFQFLSRKLNVSAKSVSHMKRSQIIEMVTGKIGGQIRETGNDL